MHRPFPFLRFPFVWVRGCGGLLESDSLRLLRSTFFVDSYFSFSSLLMAPWSFSDESGLDEEQLVSAIASHIDFVRLFKLCDDGAPAASECVCARVCRDYFMPFYLNWCYDTRVHNHQYNYVKFLHFGLMVATPVCCVLPESSFFSNIYISLLQTTLNAPRTTSFRFYLNFLLPRLMFRWFASAHRCNMAVIQTRRAHTHTSGGANSSWAQRMWVVTVDFIRYSPKKSKIHLIVCISNTLIILHRLLGVKCWPRHRAASLAHSLPLTSS